MRAQEEGSSCLRPGGEKAVQVQQGLRGGLGGVPGQAVAKRVAAVFTTHPWALAGAAFRYDLWNLKVRRLACLPCHAPSVTVATAGTPVIFLAPHPFHQLPISDLPLLRSFLFLSLSTCTPFYLVSPQARTSCFWAPGAQAASEG